MKILIYLCVILACVLVLSEAHFRRKQKQRHGHGHRHTHLHHRIHHHGHHLRHHHKHHSHHHGVRIHHGHTHFHGQNWGTPQTGAPNLNIHLINVHGHKGGTPQTQAPNVNINYIQLPTTAQSVVRDPCEALKQCTVSLESYVVDPETHTTNFALFNLNTITTFCTATQTASSCVLGLTTPCSSPAVVNKVVTVKSEALYICSSEGRRETLAVAQSTCGSDRATQSQVKGIINDCILRVNQQQGENSCQFEDQRAKCVIDAGLDRCGQDYVKYQIRILLSSSRASLGCQPVVTRSDLETIQQGSGHQTGGAGQQTGSGWKQISG